MAKYIGKRTTIEMNGKIYKIGTGPDADFSTLAAAEAAMDCDATQSAPDGNTNTRLDPVFDGPPYTTATGELRPMTPEEQRIIEDVSPYGIFSGGREMSTFNPRDLISTNHLPLWIIGNSESGTRDWANAWCLHQNEWRYFYPYQGIEYAPKICIVRIGRWNRRDDLSHVYKTLKTGAEHSQMWEFYWDSTHFRMDYRRLTLELLVHESEEGVWHQIENDGFSADRVDNSNPAYDSDNMLGMTLEEWSRWADLIISEVKGDKET